MMQETQRSRERRTCLHIWTETKPCLVCKKIMQELGGEKNGIR
jgi:hypothetical protein